METHSTTSNNIKVEIWSDVVCPFCYIGKHRFESALEKFQHSNIVEVEWKSFQLDPYAVTNSNLSVMDNLAREKGLSAAQVQESVGYIADMAKSVGLDFHFEKAIVANSFKAHRILHLAKTHGKQNELEEKLFAAYFTQGMNIDDDDVLLNLATSVGLSGDEVRKVLGSDAYSDEVKHDIAHARQLYVRGVPYFLFDGKYAVSGAQEVDFFLQTLNKAYADHKGPEVIEIPGNNPGVCGPDGCSI
ncbi:MAG TPA: DsbA family oxidoreductase [Tenuifilaceae bacterium]|nr:DsbA family oxidoreductase [Tenuifilaceae bacterium]